MEEFGRGFGGVLEGRGGGGRKNVTTRAGGRAEGDSEGFGGVWRRGGEGRTNVLHARARTGRRRGVWRGLEGFRVGGGEGMGGERDTAAVVANLPKTAEQYYFLFSSFSKK